MTAIFARLLGNPHVFAALLFALATVSGAMGYRIGHWLGDSVGHARAVAEAQVATAIANTAADERIAAARREGEASARRGVAADKTRSKVAAADAKRQMTEVDATPGDVPLPPAMSKLFDDLARGRPSP